jgi:hypothetical protein
MLALRSTVLHPLMAASLALSLAACNTSQAPAPSAALAVAPAEEQNASGSGPCGEQIDTYRRVMDNDLSMGHVNKSVFNKVIPEIDRAAALCRAGRDSEARASLAATKKRYGYR